MAQLKVGDSVIISNSSGTPTIQSGVTMQNGVNYPKGVAQGVNYLQQVQNSGTSVGGTLGGTGVQVVPFNTIRAGTEDSAFTQDILSLSSNLWTMRTGYYIWDFWRQNYYSNHVWILGIQTYGDTSGLGSTVGNITTDNVNFGITFWYTHASAAHAIPVINTGVLKVTHTTQKYVFRINTEVDNQHSTSTYTHSATFLNIQQSLRFIRIGDV